MNSYLRPAALDDEGFLFDVYASTRADEMALVPWNDEQKHAFLQMQFNAQRQSYQQQFPKAQYDIIVHDGVAAGRLIVDREGDRILLIDIALLPEHRNHGIGTKFIAELTKEAAESGKPVQLHVENFNRAYHLYERLGFQKVADEGIYSRLQWEPRTMAKVQHSLR
jgi:ribosomal protein S18 acetylase RimI-like enzyme